MRKETLTIVNKLGLHARAANKLSDLANRYASKTKVVVGEKEVDAKSIMALMLLAAAKGTEITIVTEVPDEEIALEAVCALINDKFVEGE